MMYRLEAIPFISKSLIACSYSSFSDLHILVLEILSMVLLGMVSSMRVTSSSPTSTISGWAEVTKVFSSMEDIGLYLLASQENMHTVFYCYRGIPGCLIPKLRRHYMPPSIPSLL